VGGQLTDETIWGVRGRLTRKTNRSSIFFSFGSRGSGLSRRGLQTVRRGEIPAHCKGIGRGKKGNGKGIAQ